MRVSLCALVLVFSFPFCTHAQVVINEFLYDAQGTDTDQEYIELYNAGSSAVDLTKYKINDGSNHTLNVPPKNGGTGSISMPVGGHALLVDNAANFIAAHPGLSGTVIDTVLSLSNTGTTLALLDESGAIISTVTYTKDQGAAGDGNSLQKDGASWIAAAPTPGATNAVNAVPPASTQTTSTAATNNTSPSTSNTTVSSYVAPPEPTLFVDAGGNRTVIVGADTVFYGRAYNKSKEDVDRVRFLWNFGDGSTAEGASVLHHYDYPGRYAVILDIAENRTALSAQLTVTAEPARLSFTIGGDGSVTIGNLAGRDLDLSRWMIRSFGRTFTLPEHTVILAGASIRLSHKTLNFFSGAETELDYPNGVLALSANGSAQETAAALPASAPIPEVAVKNNKTVETVSVSAEIVSETAQDNAADDASGYLPTSTQTAAAAQTQGGGAYWWIGALGFAGILGAGAITVRQMKKKEWDIVEET